MAKPLVANHHSTERNGPHHNGRGPVGPTMGGVKGLRPLRQCGNCINKKSARDPTLSRLLRLLALLCAVYDITLTARHLPGVQNTSADAPSRNRLHTFLSLNPQASPMPTVIPPSLQVLVFNSHLRSTLPTWIRKWRDTLVSASRQPLAQPMPQHKDDMPPSASSSK